MRRAVKRASNRFLIAGRDNRDSRSAAATALGLVLDDEAGHAVLDDLAEPSRG